MNGRAKYLVATLLCILALLILSDFFFWIKRFPPNCFIENVEVSGLTYYEAVNELRAIKADDAVITPITLELLGSTIKFKPSDLGIKVSPKNSVSKARNYIKKRTYLIELYKRATSSYKKRVAPLTLEVDENVYTARLKEMAGTVNRPTVEATFALLDEKRYRITKEYSGRAINVAVSIKLLKATLANDDRASLVAVDILKPRVYSKDLVKYPPKYLLSEYITYYGSHDSPGRVHNIKLAAGRTNNYVVPSGEVFSLLSQLGKFNEDNGYKEAFVIINGELEPQYGGGACQIASTIYNAALLSGLETIERHNHGIYFTIYPLGRDASIYSPSRDLRFRNNTNHPIYIKAYATDRKLTYRIYGTPTGKKVSFSSPMIYFEYEKQILYNTASPESKEKIAEAITNGKPFYTLVKVTKDHAGYRSEKIILSHYKLTGDRENVKVVRPEPR